MMKPAKDSLDIGVVVGDIKASLTFYRDILGMEVVSETPVSFGKMYLLRFGSSLFKLIDPKEVPPKGNVGLEKTLGFRYVTFNVKDLPELCAELIGRGVPFALPEKEISPGIRIAMVKDPDENIIEFVERSE